ncbi:MAG TPA: hypothetical protein VMB03_27620 [Bryobacteraceae bacterium]|nr:hypothetical protein [Bryobacteraceae bacterium]
MASMGFSGTLAAQGGRGATPPAPLINQSTDPRLHGFEFRSIGPAVMMGRVDDIVGSEQDPMTMYIGFATGGLWRSTDGGIHWKSMFDQMENESIGSVAIAPSDKNVVYVGKGEGNNRQSSSIGDGVWGTTDGGEHWSYLGLKETQSIQRVVVDPKDPKICFVAAVGHLFGPNKERGLYRTKDGGKTWQQVKYIDENTGFTDVAIDPSNGRNVYAASYERRRTWWGFNGGGANSALWKSSDGGDTWTKLDGAGWPHPKDGLYGRIALAIFRAKPSTIFAQVEAGASGGTGSGTGADGGPARGGRGGFGGGGETPAAETGAAGGAGNEGRGGRGGAGGGGGGGAEAGQGSCTPAPGSLQFGGGGRGGRPMPPNPEGSGIFRSDDGGKTWNFVSNCDDRPMYFSQIRVDPMDVNKIFTGGNPGRISHDGGKTWTNMAGSHTDYHAIWINPKDPRQVWIGHDGGFDSSNDGGVTWDYHNDIAVGQFYQVSADMRRPYWVCGGLQDNNAWCGPSALRSNGGGGGGGGAGTGYNGGPVNTDWYTVAGGDGFYTRQDPTDWAIVYGESQDGNMSRHDLRNGTQKSIKPNTGPRRPQGGTQAAEGANPEAAGGRGGGRGGAPNVLNVPANAEELRFYWNAPMEISPHNPAKIYMGAQYFFKSDDRGDTWWMNPTDLSKNVNRWGAEQEIMGVSGEKPMVEKHDGYSTSSLITQIRESPSRPGIIWVGTDDGNLQVSKDDGETFTNVIGNIHGSFVAPHGFVQIARIEPSHFDPATAYVALDAHRYDDWHPYLFKTTDYGQTWTNVTANLPEMGNIEALREDYDNPDLLFVGTEFGLFVTLDGCKTFEKFMNDLPSVRVDDILIHPRDRDLIVATHGRSIWIMDDISPLEHMKPMDESTSLVLFNPRAAIEWKNDSSQSRSITNRDFKGQNPQGGTAIRIWSKADVPGAKIEFMQNDPEHPGQLKMVSEIEPCSEKVRVGCVDIKAGMNSIQWNLMKPAPPNAGRGGRNGGGGGNAGGETRATGATTANNGRGGDVAEGAPVQFGGRGGQANGRVPFVAGGRGGGFGGFGGAANGGPVEPGSYVVRLTAGDKTYTSSVVVLEDIWMRPQ